MYSDPNRLKIGIRQDLDRMGRVEAIETDLTAEQPKKKRNVSAAIVNNMVVENRQALAR